MENTRNGEAILSVRGIQKRIDSGTHEVEILRGIDFEAPRGQFLAIRGPSGSGKTTLLRAIATLDAPVSGALRLDGESPDALGHPRWRRRVTYVAQRPAFYGGEVMDELRRPSTYASAERPFDANAAREALATLGLADKVEAPVHTLSVGEAQRVALIRAALVEPAVLLLDEPTSALDRDAAERVEAWLVERGSTLVIVSHDEAQRERVADRTIALEAG